MFSSGPNYTKLKTNLRLALNRLKLLEKKKSELTQKARKEIADYISSGKAERARIRVEHIIREDYLVEAMEIVEMYCDLVLARFGLVTQMSELDEGIAEAVSSLIWVAPRLQSDVQELKIISDVLATKYGKPFAEGARAGSPGHHVSEKLMHKMAIQAPPKLLVEKYLIEIAKNYNIEYEPDPQVMREAKEDGFLIDLSEKNNHDGAGGIPMPPGFIDFPQPPALPQMPQPPMRKPFEYPNMMGGPSGGATAPPFTYNIPPNPQGASGEKKDLNINTDFVDNERHSLPPPYSTISPDDNLQNSAKPKPQPRSKMPPDMGNSSAQPFPNLPNLPSVPNDLPDEVSREDNEDIDFDDLSRRFEELKKKK